MLLNYKCFDSETSCFPSSGFQEIAVGCCLTAFIMAFSERVTGGRRSFALLICFWEVAAALIGVCACALSTPQSYVPFAVLFPKRVLYFAAECG